MCPPVLAAAAAGVSAIGSVVGGLQAASMARYQAKIADRNAALEAEAAHETSRETIEQARLQHRKIGQVQGAQIATQAANGVDVNFGSARQVQTDTEMLGREDVDRIYRAGYQKVRGFDINAANSRAQAAASRADAKGAIVGSIFDATSSLLGGAQQYSKMGGKFG